MSHRIRSPASFAAVVGLLAGLIIGLQVRTVRALDPHKAINKFPIDTWTIDNGLPQGSVRALLQSRDGYLWLGTQEGLVRFDGVSFTTYDRHTVPAFKSNLVKALLQDRRGIIWIGTDCGVVLLDHQRFSWLGASDGLANEGIKALLEAADGAIWVAADGGISRIVGDRIDSLTTADGLPHSTISALAEDHEHRIWAATRGGGVAVIERFAVSRVITAADGLGDNEVIGMLSDSNGDLWFGTRHGLSRLHDGELRTFGVEHGLTHETVWVVLEDHHGRLWVGTSGGLDRFEDGHFSGLTRADGLSYHIVWSLLEDHEGSLWLGTSSGGINRLRDGKVISLTEQDGLTAGFVWTVLEDRAGTLWIGTDGGGLNRLDGSGVTALTVRDGLLADEVKALLLTDANDLWVGTRAGLNLVRGGAVVAYPGGPLRGNIRTVLEDHNGALWVGTDEQGLLRYDGRSFTSYGVAEGLAGSRVLCLAEDRQGTLWIGGSEGVSLLRNGQLSTLTEQDGLPGGWVLTIHEDQDGTIWLGSRYGLARIAGHEIAAFTMADGLFSDMIYKILEDDRGNLWLSCNQGIYRVAKRELEELASGARRQVTSATFSKADGMAARECNGGSQPAGWRCRDGRLLFPTVNGLVIIDPNNIPLNRVPPLVTIERLVVDGEMLNLDGPLRCPAGSRRFEISFAALSFIASQRLRFQYRLEPYDEQWIEVQGRRTAYYTGIPPGRYRFEVRAANADGIWSFETSSLDLSIKPYLYQTWWFAVACVVVLLALIWALFRFRVRQVAGRYRAVIAERQRMARGLHDTLAQGLTAISLQLEGIAETMTTDQEAATRHLAMARRIIRTSLADARRTVWNLRSQVLDSSSLGEALQQIADQLVAGTTIRTGVEVIGSRRSMPKEIEGQLLHIGQEAITNAIRHAACSSISIAIACEPGVIGLRVADNGRGFLPEARVRSDHFGLCGMKERAAALGGELRIVSGPGRGTVIEVLVPGQVGARAQLQGSPFQDLATVGRAVESLQEEPS